MNEEIVRPASRALPVAAAALLCVAGMPARAQAVDSSAVTPPTGPTPYYVGLSQGFTHDSNVYRIPFGPSDTYSSTSLLGGFDQRIGRQRVFGTADVSLNRYASQKQLDNTSYDLAGGLDWETLYDLSGNVGVGFSQHLSAPGASVSIPNPVRNIEQTQNVNARARWGGQSLVTVEATLGYLKIDYSEPIYATSDSTRKSASLGVHYGRGAPLRVGVAARFDDTYTPQAFLEPVSGTYQANTVKSSNLDLLANYELSGLLTSNVRLSYTRQTNSIGGESLSGFTGSFDLAWRATGKTSLVFNIARDAGFDANRFTTYSAVAGSSQLTPSVGQYQNARATDSATLRLSYLATAKIDAFAGASYVRARLQSTVIDASGNVVGPGSTDSLRVGFLGANYAFARNWTLACRLEHDYRHVSGATSYAYNADIIGCLARYQLHL